jgi:DNA-binding NtrC family response regulator
MMAVASAAAPASQALEHEDWNRTRSAPLLGINRRQLFDKIQQDSESAERMRPAASKESGNAKRR